MNLQYASVLCVLTGNCACNNPVRQIGINGNMDLVKGSVAGHGITGPHEIHFFLSGSLLNFIPQPCHHPEACKLIRDGNVETPVWSCKPNASPGCPVSVL